MRKKIIEIVNTKQGSFVRTRLNGKQVTIKASTNNGLYSHIDSAKRAWRKYAERNLVGNYSYSVVGV